MSVNSEHVNIADDTGNRREQIHLHVLKDCDVWLRMLNCSLYVVACSKLCVPTFNKQRDNDDQIKSNQIYLRHKAEYQ